MSVVVKYDSNNSGGSWWLDDTDWKKLEEAGWEVEWGRKDYCHSKYPSMQGESRAPNTCPPKECHGHRRYASFAEAVAANDRWLGALATAASKTFSCEEEAVREWESVLGMDASDEGCSCCGQPHSFYTSMN